MPENYRILEKPSDWLKKEGKLIEKDSESILDRFAGLFQELPGGRTENRAIQHHVTTAPGEVPVLFAWKKDGSLRWVIDYRPVNRITIKEDSSMPKIRGLTSRVGKARRFTRLHLQNGFYQAEVVKEDQQQSAFETRYGTFQCRATALGLPEAWNFPTFNATYCYERIRIRCCTLRRCGYLFSQEKSI